MNILSKNNSHTEVANPSRKTDNPIPIPMKIRILLRPNRSPNLPITGENRKAVTNVMLNVRPDQFWTYLSEKSPKVSIYNERKGMTIVMLPAMKKFANHMIIKLRFAFCCWVIPSTLLSQNEYFAFLNMIPNFCWNENQSSKQRLFRICRL